MKNRNYENKNLSSYNIVEMNKSELNKLTKKKQFVDLLLKDQQKLKKPIPAPCKSVKQMIQDYEKNIIAPPLEFRDKPVPKPRTIKPVPAPRIKKLPVPAPRTRVVELPIGAMLRVEKAIAKPRTIKSEKPILAPRTNITPVKLALKDAVKTYEIGLKNKSDPLIQLQTTRQAIGHHFKKSQLENSKNFKFYETMRITFIKEVPDNKQNDDDDIEVEIDNMGGKHYLKRKTAHFNSKAKTITNIIDLNQQLKISQEEILKKIAQWLSEGSGWIIDKIDNHYLNIVEYVPLSAKSYIQLPKELRNLLKGLINMKNKDNECFCWWHIRHLNPQENDS